MPASARLVFLVNHTGFFLSHRLPLALAAREAGYDVHVATPRSKHVPALQQTGLPWQEVRLSRSGLNPFLEARSLASIHALYRRLRPALVHHITAKPVIYGTLAARMAGVPAVVNAVSGMGHAFTPGGIGRRMLRGTISTGYRLALRHPNMRVIVQNREHGEFVGARGWVRPADIRLLPGSGVDMRRFVPRGARERSRVRVVLVARLLYSKGVADFVEAARMLKARGVDANAVLVGEPDRDNPASIPLSVLQRWHAEGVIEYAGRQAEMTAVYADADIACLPTYTEGMPKSLVEAAACGLPIVTTDWPGCRDLVADGENGILVPIKDPRALADALEKLARDPSLRAEMGRNGRARVERDFAVETITRKTLELYRELLAAS
jgi:glycosyltransferase involved in cell wall biosynthesis